MSQVVIFNQVKYSKISTMRFTGNKKNASSENRIIQMLTKTPMKNGEHSSYTTCLTS